MTRAVVLGGGLAGVLTAGVLARHSDDVVLIEGDRYPAGPAPRAGLPQAHHSHLLVTGGARALDTLVPGAIDTLLARGAHRLGMSGDALIFSGGGWFRRFDTGAYLISCSRWLTDRTVRELALAGRDVQVREGSPVIGLTGDSSRVTGVRIRRPDAGTETIPADLVVDATGRRSRAARWLGGTVEETVVDPGVGYCTRVLRAPAGVDLPAVMIHPGPDSYGGTLFPIEDGRWIATVTGARGMRPPADDEGFTAATYSLRSTVLAELIAAAEPAGAVRVFRGTANRRRHYERGRSPGGLVVLGDALMAVNPVYSHGMAVAAMSVLRLAGELDRHGLDPAAAPVLQTAMAEEADSSWRTAIEQDVPSSPRTGVQELLARAVPTSPRLMTELFRAQTLAGPGILPPHGGGPVLTDAAAIAQFPQLTPLLSASAGRAFR